MPPQRPLPICEEFASTEEYVEELLRFTTTSDVFQTLCGGVHILDFFVSEPGLFFTLLPQDWQAFLLECEPIELLHVLKGLSLHGSPLDRLAARIPPSLDRYIKDVNRLSLLRSFSPRKPRLETLPREVALGMNPKKIHEVTQFAGFVDYLSDDISRASGKEVTHVVDLGSGQNYFGRTMASPPYNRYVVAVEGRAANTAGAMDLDILSGFAKKEPVIRNKRVYSQVLASQVPMEKLNSKALRRAAMARTFTSEEVAAVDLRPRQQLENVYTQEVGKGFIQYVTGKLAGADLSDVVSQIESEDKLNTDKENSLIAVSIHSCGNLSHFGIRSLLSNPSVHAVAIVGCCYNLMTERLGLPPSGGRPMPQPVNERIKREASRKDPEGFPMSNRLCTYGEQGVRFNVTARMLACQALQNWTEKDADQFFTRHFYRAVLQKIFLDRGVVNKVHHAQADGKSSQDEAERREEDTSSFNMSTNPVILGTLPKRCYVSFRAYVRGAITKLLTHPDLSRYKTVVEARMAGITDDEIDRYEATYSPRKKELSATWSLMAFSGCLVESVVVTDRWLFLAEHDDAVGQCWVEAVFDYNQSPRNLVVVGIKR